MTHSSNRGSPPVWLALWAAIVVGAVFVAFLVGTLFQGAAHAHDLWISRGSYRNPAGEWCCGVSDCGVVQASGVRAAIGGYQVNSIVHYGASATGDAQDGPARAEPIHEFVPYTQALPSPDGSYWRCKRPDGSNRCFFAPKRDY